MLKQTNIKLKRRLTVAGLAAVAIAAIVPFASSSAYGPERRTFTVKEPADYPTFNSITDNPAVGDERNFVRVIEVGNGGNYRDTAKVTAGKEYEVYIYFHNNAKSRLNNEEGAPGIAKQVKVATGLSTWTINSSKKAKISATISSINTNPTEVWDEAYLETDSAKDIVLKYVSASAIIHNGYGANGTVLSQSLFSTEGTYIGEEYLNGYIPGCAEFSGFITYRLRADVADSTVKKTVSKNGTDFYDSVDAKPGDTLTYKIEFKNTGTLDLTNVTFHDKLPNGVKLVNGTTNLVDPARPNGHIMEDVIGANGFKTGNYAKDTTVSITYKVKLDDNIVADYKCNATGSFKNKIIVDYNVGNTDEVGEVYDSATINVKKECEDKTCEPGDPECCQPGDPGCDDTDECDPNDKDCICEKDPDNEICKDEDVPGTPGEFPKTGPGEIALAIVAVVCITTGGIYWYRSQKDLAKVEKGLSKGKK